MRRSVFPLVCTLLALFCGTASAQSDGETTGRQLRRQHRLAQLNALRRMRGRAERTLSDAPSRNTEDLYHILPVDRLVVCPAPDQVKPEPIFLGPPDKADPPEVARKGRLLGPPVEADPTDPQGAAIWEGFPNEDGEYDNGEWDYECPPRRYYALDNLRPDSATTRNTPGSDASDRGTRADRFLDAIPFVDRIRGKSGPRDQPVDFTRDRRDRNGGNFDPERGDRILARRLAQIDRMRDDALIDDNTELLDKADRLEAIARAQHARRVDGDPEE